MNPFEPIFARLLTLLPFLETDTGKTMRCVYLIQEWIASGADPELDILPAINKGWAKSSHKIESVMYFDKFVKEAKDKRCGSIEAVHQRAKNIAYATRKLGKRMPHEERWLVEYEAQHGPVTQPEGVR